MVADLCHGVFSCCRGESVLTRKTKAEQMHVNLLLHSSWPGHNEKSRQNEGEKVTFSSLGWRLFATTTRKCDNAKMRQNATSSCFRLWPTM